LQDTCQREFETERRGDLLRFTGATPGNAGVRGNTPVIGGLVSSLDWVVHTAARKAINRDTRHPPGNSAFVPEINEQQ